MANTAKSTTSKRGAAKQSEVATPVAAHADQDSIAEDATVGMVSAPVKPKDIDPNQYVTVRNGFQGTLVYKSSRTGERYVWDEFGAEQEIDLRELRNAKSAHKKMFENNWFMFDEDWIIDYLGVRQYYKHALNVEDFDSIFKMPPSAIAETIGGMSAGQKRSVSYRARQLIADGEIDSRKLIATLENSLGVELIEK